MCLSKQRTWRRLFPARPTAWGVGLVLVLACLLCAPALAAPAHAATLAPAAGGPDDFGYTYRDSNEPGGPVYAWEDIHTTGTLATGWTSTDDGYAGPFPIGFTFDYYGQPYNELYIGVNGYLSFGQGYGSIPGGTLPNSNSPNNDIALFGSDLYLYDYGTESAVYYQTLANPERLVVQFVNIHYCCGYNTQHTFEVILYATGDIQAQYQSLNGTATSYVGIENSNGSDGLGYAGSLADQLAIRYYYPVGVFVTPAVQSGFGAANTMVTYALHITNRTGTPDRFALTVDSGHAWPTSLSVPETGTLANGQSVTVQAQVTVPAGALPGTQDEATIRVTSVNAPAQYVDTAVIHTTATSGELAYVTLDSHDLVALVDQELHQVVGTIDVGTAGCDRPMRAAMAPNGMMVVVTCDYSGNVAIIDTTNSTITRVIDGVPSGYWIAFTRDSSYALITGNYAVRVVDLKTGTVTNVSAPAATNQIAVHPYLDVAYIASWDSSLLVFDTSTFTFSSAIPIGNSTTGVAIPPTGQWIFAAGGCTNNLFVIDATTGTIHTTVPIPGACMTTVTTSPDGAKVYVGDEYNAVHVVDGMTFQPITDVGGVGSGYGLATTCDGYELYVANSSGTLPIVDTTTYAIAHQLAMPGYGIYGLALCPQVVARGVLLVPPTQSHAGARGATVTHELTIVNAQDHAETFNLALRAGAWPASISTSTIGPLATGQTATFQVLVTVPANVPWYAADKVGVTATAASDPTAFDTAEVTTQAYAPALLSVVPESMTSSLLAGQVAEQILTVSNGNGVTLTVELSDELVTPGTQAVAPFDLPRAVDAFPPRGTAHPDRPPRQPVPPTGAVTRALAANVQPSAEIRAGSYFTTTVDNENNQHTGTPDNDMDGDVCGGNFNEPIEFNIFIDRPPGHAGSALTVRAYDVDWPAEVDEVRVNGTFLGDLVGQDQTWSETVFAIPAGVLVEGKNLVEVDVTSTNWCVYVDWGEMFIASAPAPWLHENPATATIPSNSSQDIIVTFDASGMQPGEHHASIIVTGEDSVPPEARVPVTMTVNPTPDMGRVVGTVTDAWTGQPLTATIELVGVYAMLATPDYQIWATAGSYSLMASAPGYFTITLPVAITAGGITQQPVALEPAQARITWTPTAIVASVEPGGMARVTLDMANTGPVPLDFALFEIDPQVQERAPGPDDLQGARILVDRSHGEADLSAYSILVSDITSAGGMVAENWTYPLTRQVLEDYDVLWINCCGSTPWSFGEMNAIYDWLRRGGAVLVQGESSIASSGPASIFDVTYTWINCWSGITSHIAPHAISQHVGAVYVSYTCTGLAAGPDAAAVVFDPNGQPHAVAVQRLGGKMVVIADEDFADGAIQSSDNRLFANNVMAWLARPAYTDVTWLATAPVSGTVPGHSRLPVVVELDAANLPSGLYEAVLAIEHNDPAQAFPVEVPVTFAVQIPTALALSELTATATAAAPPAVVLGGIVLTVIALAAWTRRRVRR
jgi:WD40 repeat protein